MSIPKQDYFFKYRAWNKIPKAIVDSVIKDILKVVKIELDKPAREWAVLDIGCGGGEYSFALSKYVKKVIGVEPYKPLYNLAIKNKKNNYSKVKFVNLPVEKFNTKRKFDLIISLTTLEHMPEQEKSFEKIFSLMKMGGVIYLTAPNKLWPLESHYKLPFLSLLPLPIANIYLRISKRGNSYEDSCYSKSYFGMKAFFDKFTCRYKFVLPDPNSAYLGCGVQNSSYHFMKRLGIFLINKFQIFWIISKGFIMVIKKI